MGSSGRWWRRDIRPRYVVLGVLALMVLAFGVNRVIDRHHAQVERQQLAEALDRFTIAGSGSTEPSSVVDRDCPSGLSRRAIRQERSSLGVDDVLEDLMDQAAEAGWGAISYGLEMPDSSVVFGVDTPSRSVTRYLGDRELEVSITEGDDGTQVRLTLSAGVVGLIGCY